MLVAEKNTPGDSFQTLRILCHSDYTLTSPLITKTLSGLNEVMQD